MSEVRLIDADELEKRVRDDIRLYDSSRIYNVFDQMKRDSLVEIAERIEHAPTVDAVPVRHGYNKQFEFPSQFTCSVCGWESWDTYCCDTDTFNYCPNCGAKMDGADGERQPANGYGVMAARMLE